MAKGEDRVSGSNRSGGQLRLKHGDFNILVVKTQFKREKGYHLVYLLHNRAF